jgi:hypothetical protein
VRELGNPRHKEFMLPDALLDSYVGSYGRASGTGEGERLPDGLLSLTLADRELVMHADVDDGVLRPDDRRAVRVRCHGRRSSELDLSVGDPQEKAMKLDRLP